MSEAGNARSAKSLFVLLVWLTFLGWAVWQHARQSDQPPIYDAATYYQKAHNFWAVATQSKLFNPFNVEPTFRPPGTVVMSYPLGFDVDYRGFYFRSVFFPITLLVLAVVVAGYQGVLESATKWYLVVIAIFLSTLPIFYYFDVAREFPAPTYWGLVDNFLGGVAALAAAAVVRSVATRSLAWTGAAAVLSSFSLLVKPAGSLVIGLVDIIWFGLGVSRLVSERHVPEEKRRTLRWLSRGVVVFAVLDAAVVGASFLSRYLSWQNLAFGKANTVIMQNELHVTWPELQSVVKMGLGYPYVAWLLLIGLFAAMALRSMPRGSWPWTAPMLSGLGLASLSTFGFGIWFWIFEAGGVYTIRYFIPFALMATIFAVPVVVRAIPIMQPRQRVVLSLLMIVPIANLSMLLVQRDPSVEWQRWAGVNLSSGKHDAVAAQAKQFVEHVKREGHDVAIYSMPMNVSDAELQAVIDYSRITDRNMPLVSIRRPMDWQRATTFRLGEMLSARYWLFEPVLDPGVAKATLARPSVDDLDQEKAVFQGWASQLTVNDGVGILSETPTARILRIVDPALLETSMEKLVESHQWRSAFTTANPRRRWSEKSLEDALARTPPALENVQFGDRIALRALSVERTTNETTVRLWWKPMPAMKEHDWIFFIHSINARGDIVLNNQIPLEIPDGPPREDTILLSSISFPNPPHDTATHLAIGFYRPDQSKLVADKGTRDWNGTRVIVPAR